MNYSRRQLEAFGEPFGESATRLKPGGRIYGMGGGGDGGGGATTTTVNQSNIPEWLRPQVEGIIGGASQEMFDYTVDENGNYVLKGAKPFVPYSSNVQDYTAGFSPLQQQVQANAANLQMPGQFNQATGYANAAGQGGIESANQAYGYGNAGFQSGQQGQQIGMQGGDYYGNMGAQAGLQGQQSGLLGQQLGIQGGQYYGGMGANMGQQAAALSNQALGYGQAGYGSGQIGQQLALDAAQRYGQMGSGYGYEAAALAPQAQQYGQSAADIGRMGLRAEALGQDITGQARNYAAQQAAAGQDYARQMTSPSAIQQYMSPYQAAVTDVQLQGLQRQADIATNMRKSQAARAGAYGGARQAVENAEADRALASQMDAVRAQGQQAAYDKAVQAMQYGSNLGLQGLGGAQSGLGTALQGGQLGLSGIGQAMAGQQAGISGLNQAGNLYGLGMQGAGMGLQAAQTGLQGTAQGMQGAQAGLAGVGAANQAFQTGIQGAQAGLQGVNAQLAGTAQGMQGAQAAMQGAGVGLSGVDRQLAGTAQGMQGAQVGLQGVSGAQAGYGLADRAAGTLGTLGQQQLAAQTGILGLQNQIGAQQQGQQQQYINQAIQNFAQAQENPMQRYNQINALVRGYSVPGTTTSQYQAAPSLLTQVGGAGIAGLGLYNAMNPATR